MTTATLVAEATRIPLDKICARDNVRTQLLQEDIDALAGSIDLLGVLQPVIVAPLQNDPDGFDYALVAGYTRYAACAQLGHPDIPASVREADEADTAAAQAAENVASCRRRHEVIFWVGRAEDVLNERGNGLIDDETPFALALLSGHRYVFPLWATFHPQAWQNDHAVDVDPEGTTRWQINIDHLLSITHHHSSDVPEALKETTTANTSASDALRDDAAAPAWVREWSGPFYVSVEDSAGTLIELLTEPRG